MFIDRPPSRGGIIVTSTSLGVGGIRNAEARRASKGRAASAGGMYIVFLLNTPALGHLSVRHSMVKVDSNTGGGKYEKVPYAWSQIQVGKCVRSRKDLQSVCRRRTMVTKHKQ